MKLDKIQILVFKSSNTIHLPALDMAKNLEFPKSKTQLDLVNGLTHPNTNTQKTTTQNYQSNTNKVG